MADFGADLLYWIVTEGAMLPSIKDALAQLVTRAIDGGIQLHRLTLVHPTLHPEIRGIRYDWLSDDGLVSERAVPHWVAETDTYLQSPFRLLFDGAGGVHWRLRGQDHEFPLLNELQAQGYTDYVALPLIFTDGRRGASSWATRCPKGFSSEQLARIDALLPGLALLVETHSARRAMESLLATYLGHATAYQVRTGQIRRGDGETMRAVVWYCDMRGFTALSEQLDQADLLALLNDYFQAIVEPVHLFGGEVLKFIGDAVLAVFRMDGGRLTDREAAENAIQAARAALERLEDLNRRDGQAPLRTAIALNVGDVSYGNVGSVTRLDFTIIGQAVNLAARLEALAGQLGISLVSSAQFAALSPCAMRSLGHFSLKNVAEAQEVFAPVV